MLPLITFYFQILHLYLLSLSFVIWLLLVLHLLMSPSLSVVSFLGFSSILICLTLRSIFSLDVAFYNTLSRFASNSLDFINLKYFLAIHFLHRLDLQRLFILFLFFPICSYFYILECFITMGQLFKNSHFLQLIKAENGCRRTTNGHKAVNTIIINGYFSKILFLYSCFLIKTLHRFNPSLLWQTCLFNFFSFENNVSRFSFASSTSWRLKCTAALTIDANLIKRQENN